MKLLIKSVKIIDSKSPHHGKAKDILIDKGKIISIGDNLTDKDAKVIEQKGLHVSPGWCDMKANFCDPGYEYKEDIHSGINAAAAGGFTAVVVMPSTNPVVHSKSEVEYILNKSKGKITEIYPAGALSVNSEGKDMAELHDMYLAGAVAFTDDKRPVSDSGLMIRALQYVSNINVRVMAYAEDRYVTGRSIVNESLQTTMNGFKGAPSLAEEMMIERDISISRYTGMPLHFSTITSARSVELIRAAKKKGMKITCDVAAHYLLLDDSMLGDYNSNYKVKPPLRTKDDVEALIKGLKDGTIDAICSDHSPQDDESKKVEFDFASFGIIGLETAFAVANTALKDHLTTEQIIEKFSSAPRNILGINNPVIKENEAANLTLFNPAAEWTFTKDDIKSKSSNTPFIGWKFTGKVAGVVNKGMLWHK
jgi:dihydroorotase